MSDTSVSVQLKQKQDFQFEINFGNSLPIILGDEPPPIGEGKGPSPAQFLAAAVGNCLSDSLFFAIAQSRKASDKEFLLKSASATQAAKSLNKLALSDRLRKHVNDNDAGHNKAHPDNGRQIERLTK